MLSIYSNYVLLYIAVETVSSFQSRLRCGEAISKSNVQAFQEVCLELDPSLKVRVWGSQHFILNHALITSYLVWELFWSCVFICACAQYSFPLWHMCRPYMAIHMAYPKTVWHGSHSNTYIHVHMGVYDYNVYFYTWLPYVFGGGLEDVVEEVNKKIAERRADRRAARNACNASEDMHHGYSITPQHTFQNELIKKNVYILHNGFLYKSFSSWCYDLEFYVYSFLHATPSKGNI